MAIAWLNGNYIDDESAALSLLDTGLLHAAGVFTTLRADGGRVFRLEQHLTRLRKSCDALFVPLQHSDAGLAAAVDGVMQQNNLRAARLRLTVTRGQSSQDRLHGTVLSPNCFLTVTELQPYPEEFYKTGVMIVAEDEQKLNPYDLQAGHKTLNYFSRLFTLREAARRGAAETLWFNVHNYLQSGSISNVFLVKAGELWTPPTQEDLRRPDVAQACPYKRSNVLPGILRQAVLEIAQQSGIDVHIGPIDINALLSADELFLTNSIMRILPVAKLEQHDYAIPGTITTRLMEGLARELRE